MPERPSTASRTVEGKNYREGKVRSIKNTVHANTIAILINEQMKATMSERA
jgi:hypothetical protein